MRGARIFSQRVLDRKVLRIAASSDSCQPCYMNLDTPIRARRLAVLHPELKRQWSISD